MKSREGAFQAVPEGAAPLTGGGQQVSASWWPRTQPGEGSRGSHSGGAEVTSPHGPIFN